MKIFIILLTLIASFPIMSAEGLTIVGTEEDDTLIGTEFDDRIDGLGGNDEIDGGAGNDHIRGSKGDDTLMGGFNDDIIRGGKGADILKGNRGKDFLSGGGGNDSLDGGPGADVMLGRSGNDVFEGGSGSDRMDGGSGNDRLFLGPGDTAEGGQGDDLITSRRDGRLTLIGYELDSDTPGLGERDTLRARVGRVLGRSFLATPIFNDPYVYQLGDRNSGVAYVGRGDQDFAIIENFENVAGVASDKVQVTGNNTDFLVAVSTNPDIPGLAIYHWTNFEETDLIAIVRDYHDVEALLNAFIFD